MAEAENCLPVLYTVSLSSIVLYCTVPCYVVLLIFDKHLIDLRGLANRCLHVVYPFKILLIETMKHPQRELIKLYVDV